VEEIARKIRVFALNNVIISRKMRLVADNRYDSLTKFIDGGHIDVGKIGCSQWQ
jgi:hypothetical protein